jgi:CheY-like chemotaxis protein
MFMAPLERRSLSERRILAVDDQPATLMVVSRILQSAGARTDTASSREEALLRLEEHEYDLVLLDVGLSGVPVENTVRSIREQRPKAVVLLMTGGASQSEIESARAVGAVGPLLKPFEPKVLVQAVRNHL